MQNAVFVDEHVFGEGPVVLAVVFIAGRPSTCAERRPRQAVLAGPGMTDRRPSASTNVGPPRAGRATRAAELVALGDDLRRSYPTPPEHVDGRAALTPCGSLTARREDRRRSPISSIVRSSRPCRTSASLRNFAHASPLSVLRTGPLQAPLRCSPDTRLAVAPLMLLRPRCCAPGRSGHAPLLAGIPGSPSLRSWPESAGGLRKRQLGPSTRRSSAARWCVSGRPTAAMRTA
jgi:hypothetical protein